MKRGKIVGPMFPRLHVNDADQGGPRAPPRNKMALYEQLSIPSQRFTHSGQKMIHSTDSLTLSQGGGNETSKLLPRQLTPRLQPEKKYIQYFDSTTPTQTQQRKKSDEEESTVPIFIRSKTIQECGHGINRENLSTLNSSTVPIFIRSKPIQEYGHDINMENPSPLKSSYSNHPTKWGPIGNNPQKTLSQNSKGVNSGQSPLVKTVSNSLNYEKTEPRSAGRGNSTATVGQRFSESYKRNHSNSIRDFQSKDRNNIDRSNSLSETSIIEVELDMTPDDVVEMIGQKHFWKARRAIVNQQRAFAVQVFELHRLIEVQRGIATSTHQLEPSFLEKPIKPATKNNLTLFLEKPIKPMTKKNDHLVKALPSIPKKKGDDLETTENKNDCSVENTAKIPSSSVQNSIPTPQLPSISMNPNPNPNPTPWGFNPPQPHQWLIPVMSPSEGLVYKPYPMMGNFVNPPPPQNPNDFFPPYCMPVINSTFSCSSVDQTNPLVPGRFSAREENEEAQILIPKPVQESNVQTYVDIDIQTSIASCPSDRPPRNGRRRNVLSLFPTNDEVSDSTPARVIKVVPHHSRSATESAARIFQSIQEERKQYGSAMSNC